MSAIFFFSYITLWILLVAQGVLVLLLYRHFGLVALGTIEGVQRDGLSVGETAPRFSGITVSEQSIIWEPLPQHTYFLAFVSPTCSPCARIIPAINQIAVTNKNIQIILVVAGLRDSLELLVNRFHLSSSIICLAEEGSGTAELYRVRITPFAFLIGTDKRILAKGLCDKPERLREMFTIGGQEVWYAEEIPSSLEE